LSFESGKPLNAPFAFKGARSGGPFAVVGGGAYRVVSVEGWEEGTRVCRERLTAPWLQSCRCHRPAVPEYVVRVMTARCCDGDDIPLWNYTLHRDYAARPASVSRSVCLSQCLLVAFCPLSTRIWPLRHSVIPRWTQSLWCARTNG